MEMTNEQLIISIIDNWAKAVRAKDLISVQVYDGNREKHPSNRRPNLSRSRPRPRGARLPWAGQYVLSCESGKGFCNGAEILHKSLVEVGEP